MSKITIIITEKEIEDIEVNLGDTVKSMTKDSDKHKVSEYWLFLKNMRENLHIMMGFCSNKSSILRERFRKFPSLINCCYINYVFEWPKEQKT